MDRTRSSPRPADNRHPRDDRPTKGKDPKDYGPDLGEFPKVREGEDSPQDHGRPKDSGRGGA